MPERPTVPGRIVVGVTGIIAFLVLLWLLQDGLTGEIADGSIDVQVILSP